MDKKRKRDPFDFRKEEAKYVFPDIGRGALKLTKSDILLLIAILEFGPMSQHKFLEKVERIYNHDSFIFPYVVKNKNELDRINWMIAQCKSMEELSRKFSRLLEEPHAPTVRLSNKCPMCEDGRLEKDFSGESDLAEATWICKVCERSFRFSMLVEQLVTNTNDEGEQGEETKSSEEATNDETSK